MRLIILIENDPATEPRPIAFIEIGTPNIRILGPLEEAPPAPPLESFSAENGAAAGELSAQDMEHLNAAETEEIQQAEAPAPEPARLQVGVHNPPPQAAAPQSVPVHLRAVGVQHTT